MKIEHRTKILKDNIMLGLHRFLGFNLAFLLLLILVRIYEYVYLRMTITLPPEAEVLNYESDLAKIYLLEAQIHAAAGQDPQAAFARAIELFQKLKRNRDADQAANELAAWKSR